MRLSRDRGEVIHNLETRLGRVPIDARHIRKQVEPSLRIVAEELARGNDLIAVDPDRKLIPIELCALNGRGIPGQKRCEFCLVFELFNVGDCRGERHYFTLPSITSSSETLSF